MKRLSETEGVVVNTPQMNSAPHIINFSVPGIKAEVLLHMLEETGYIRLNNIGLLGKRA